MKLILKQNIEKSKKEYRDFEINPLSSSFITIGKKLTFFKRDLDSNFKQEKIITRKIDEAEIIKYIKEENQLFISSTFYVKNSDNNVYKCDSSKQKIISSVFSGDKNIEVLRISSLGKIIYIYKNKLYSFDSILKKEICVDLNSPFEATHNIYVYNENIVIKTRLFNEQNNLIRIFSPDLNNICTINSKGAYTFIKLIGIYLYCGTSDGYVEIIDATNNNIITSEKISDSSITFIENDDEWYYFGNSLGKLIVTTDKLEILDSIKIFKQEIKKIKYFDDTLYVMSEEGNIAILSVIDDDNTSVIGKFMNMYKIHNDYADFFTTARVTTIENFIKKLKINNINFMPHENLIFKALESPIMNKKVCILGKDPYFQSDVATGLAFEVKKKSWSEKSINSSLKNILKLIYYSYTGERKEISEIRKDIDSGKFKILAPDKLFKSWEQQGVLLLNTALTVVCGSAGSHHKFWNDITKDLLAYISLKNTNIVYLLWGKDAKAFDKYILSGKKIEHNHPAISGNTDNINDFSNGLSFIETKNIINWLGGEK